MNELEIEDDTGYRRDFGAGMDEWMERVVSLRLRDVTCLLLVYK